MKILIVDDDPCVRDTVGAMLTQAGHPIQKVPDAQRALAVLRHRAPDLVITDIRMPGLTGLDLCRAVKNLYPDLPVIGMSGHATDEVEVREGLFDGFLQKPFGLADLLDKVEEVRRSRLWSTEIKS